MFSELLSLVDILIHHRRRVRMTIQEGIVFMANGDTHRMVFVEATNIGHRDVVIGSMGIEFPDRRFIPAGLHYGSSVGLRDDSLPARLADGETAKAYFLYETVTSALAEHYPLGMEVKIRAMCRDSAGKRHLGEKLKFKVRLFEAKG